MYLLFAVPWKASTLPKIRGGWAGGEQWISGEQCTSAKRSNHFQPLMQKSDQKEENIGLVSLKKEQDLILNWSLTILLPCLLFLPQ